MPAPRMTSYGTCMTMLSFRVDEEDAAAIQRWADELGIDRSVLLRDAVRQHLNGWPQRTTSTDGRTCRSPTASRPWRRSPTGVQPKTGRTGPMQRVRSGLRPPPAATAPSGPRPRPGGRPNRLRRRRRPDPHRRGVGLRAGAHASRRRADGLRRQLRQHPHHPPHHLPAPGDHPPTEPDGPSLPNPPGRHRLLTSRATRRKPRVRGRVVGVEAALGTL